MTDNIRLVDEKSQIPLFGLDFLGILDRGTNVLEIKPITICNLRCKYCFVSAGEYDKNFIIESNYLIAFIKRAIQIKKCDNIEIHIAPYGEIVLYNEFIELIQKLRMIPQIKTISSQSNGLLLNKEIIKKLETAGLNRFNISLNTMDPDQAATLCGVNHYNLTHLLQIFDLILKSSLELLIAPVWFIGLNDLGIYKIIEFCKEKKVEYPWPKLRLGIQNYLTYKTGRKIRKLHSREFSYFYKLLNQLEKESGLKLKLGPVDFGIYQTQSISPPVTINQELDIEIIENGRWNNEYIGRLSSEWAVKIISNQFFPIGKRVRIKIIKGNLSGNLLTGIPI